MNAPVVVSAIIFIGTYAAILSKRFHRSTAAVAGAVAMVLSGLYLGFYTETEVITQAIDWNTIGLLLGMMLVVGSIEDTGLFESLAIGVAKLSKGRYFYLMMFFGFLTAGASTTVDNVTTILLVIPITLSICSELGIDPKPILLVEALFSDVGGVATLVGDPPNVMISSAAGFSYMDFIYNLAPVVLICTIASVIVFKFLFAEKIEEENSKIDKKAREKLTKKDPTKEIGDWSFLQKSLVILTIIVFLFVVHHDLHLMPATVALLGAALIMVFGESDIEEVISRVEWTTLVFFAGLFVVVHGVAENGLFRGLALGVLNFTGGSFVLSILAILFIAAFGSAIVDNIPFTAAMIPVIGVMSAKLGGGSSLLWWALAFGAGFGANGTYIGSSANVITVNMSEKYGEPITFKYWLKHGSVLMLVTLAIAALALVVQAVTQFHVPLLPG